MRQYIRKADIILFIVLIVLGLGATALLSLQSSVVGTSYNVVIKSGGKLIGTYPLGKDTVLEIPAAEGVHYDSPGHYALTDEDECTQYEYYNVIRIEGGEVKISGSSCRNRVCVNHGSISRPGESIVCLPNRLIVTVESSEGGGYDSITS